MSNDPGVSAAPTLPRAGAQWPPPPEVEVDYHRHQVLALREDNGEPYAQYVECADGCGYVIGCGDAIESVSHLSCAEKAANRRKFLEAAKHGTDEERCYD